MAEKQKYWIADAEGTRALVEGADERDRWTRVQGWTEAEEPGRHDFVWLRNQDPELGPTRMTWEAAQLDAWAVRGWTPGAPPEPVNPAVAHWALTGGQVYEPAAEPAPKSSAKSATSGDKSKEQVNG